MDYLLLLRPTKRKNQKRTIGTQIGTPVGDIPNITNSKIRIFKQTYFTRNPSPASGRGNPQENSTPKTKNKKGIATNVANLVIM